VLYDALLYLGYDREVPIYRYRLSMTNGLDICETNVTIPFNQEDPWTETIVGSEPNSTIEQTAHVALTSLCESHITATTTMQNQENPMWKQHLEAVSDLKVPHLSAGMAVMARYMQYLFNLQHNTARTVMQQRMRLTTYDEHNTSISHELEQLKQENALFHSGTLPPSDQDHELKVAYRCLSEAKHVWNYTCQ
jgi:hypothetical protein